MHANRAREISKSHKQYAEDLQYEYLRAESLGGIYEAACMGEHGVHVQHNCDCAIILKLKQYLEDNCGYVVTILKTNEFAIEWHS